MVDVRPGKNGGAYHPVSKFNTKVRGANPSKTRTQYLSTQKELKR